MGAVYIALDGTSHAVDHVGTSEIILRPYVRLMFLLKWFSIVWTSLATVLFVGSYVLLWLQLGRGPFDVRSWSWADFVVLYTPGIAALLVHGFFEKRSKRTEEALPDEDARDD